VIRVAAGVLVRDGKVLVCRRPLEAAAHPGRWEFPGGKLEDGETFEQALVRELREELDVEASVGPELGRVVHRYAERDSVDLRFFAVGAEAEPRAEGFAEIRWQPLGRLGELDFLEADRELVAELDQRASRNESSEIAGK
jgi:8-oxo-dGTP diphosphatase